MASSQPDDSVRRIQAALTELKPLDQYEEFHSRLITGILDPPSYIAELVLCGFGGFRRWRQEEKSRWQVQVNFRGAKLQVRDWKGTALSIDGQSASEELRKLSTSLVEKIRSAGMILDRQLQTHARSKLATGEFGLVNTYSKAKRLYEQFSADLVETAAALDGHLRAEIPPHDVEHPPGAVAVIDQVTTDYLNKASQLTRKVAGYGCAAIAFYFAYLEVLMDVLYPFLGKPSMQFPAFRQRTLDERFKETFPVDQDREMKEIYDALLHLWRETRSVVLHGYSGQEGILVPLGKFGLVPISYISMLNAPHFEIFPIDPDDARSALDVFERMESWLKSAAPYKYCIRLASEEFVIPFQPDRIEEFKREMTTMEEFERFLEERARVHDYLAEQY